MYVQYDEINKFPFTLKQIKYFIAVVEYGKVTTAAKYIFISPSVITKSIKDIEQQLQVSLFTRSKNGLKLTNEGDIFLRHCNEILSAVSATNNATKNLTNWQANNLEGTIKVGCTKTISGYLLSQVIYQFKISFPNININVKEYPRIILENKTIKGDLDLAFILTDNIQDKKNLLYEIIIASPRNLWVPYNHKLTKKEVVTIEDIAKQPFIQLVYDEAKESNLRYWKNFNLKPNIIFESTSIESIRSMVSAGLGVTILSDMVYRPWSMDGKRIERIKIMNPTHSMNVGLAWSRHQKKKPETKQLIKFCKTKFSNF